MTYIYIERERELFYVILPLNMLIFHSYVNLLEGKRHHRQAKKGPSRDGTNGEVPKLIKHGWGLSDQVEIFMGTSSST